METRRRSSSLDMSELSQQASGSGTTTSLDAVNAKPPNYAGASTTEFHHQFAVATAGGGGRATATTLSSTTSTQPRRLYRTAANKSVNVARELAALDFLAGIPLEAEGRIVRDGFLKERRIEKEEAKTTDDDSEASRSALPFDTPTNLQGKWWEKWIKTAANHDQQILQAVDDKNNAENEDRYNAELERPEAGERHNTPANTTRSSVWQAYAPGRRLEGDKAVKVQIPVTTKTLTKQRTIARQAALREWESQTASGVYDGKKLNPPLSDGRLFFSAGFAYPVGVMSVIRYEPRKEEQQLRRQKLEALGGGGTQFVPPSRDWRGVSYRSLLPRKRQADSHFFDRFRSDKSESIDKYNRESLDGDEDDTSTSSSSSDDWEEYQPDLLDDPDMKLGRHRNVIVGDRALGPMISSTIQFVKPDLLKAELNKQFRERFDGWEPPRAARKFIGARVVDGEYKLMDPTMDYGDEATSTGRRKRQESVASTNSVGTGKDTATTTAASTTKEMNLRLPPSLTLSKIRSLKHQALLAAVKAKLEIGSLALACVYFERLCLDCRVDKSNRRLTFAVCMLLAVKMNEPHVGLFRKKETLRKMNEDEEAPETMQYLLGLNERSRTMFESLLGFFTQEWNLSLKRIFDAEWGVFAALGFSLHARPSHVAFHFKRLMKTLEWNIRDYLGREMQDQWSRSLDIEEDRLRERERRRERKRREREDRILSLRIEIENEVIRRKTEERKEEKKASTRGHDPDSPNTPVSPEATHEHGRKKAVDRVKSGGIRLLSRMRRVKSSGKLAEEQNGAAAMHSEHAGAHRRGSGFPGIHLSPSSPVLSSLATESVSQLSVVVPAEHTTTIAMDNPVLQKDGDGRDVGNDDDDGSIGSLTL